jgi:hypothetical protein
MKLLGTALGMVAGNKWKKDITRALRTAQAALILFIVTMAFILVTMLIVSIYFVMQIVGAIAG